MRVAISGASGFVGRALLSRLVQGQLVDGSSASKPMITPKAIVHRQASADTLLGKYSDLEVCHVIPGDRGALRTALTGVDVFVHLAWSSVPRTAAADPALDLDGNVEQGLHLLEAVASAGVQRMVFISSGGTVYGAASGAPIKEDAPLRPVNAYAAGKVCFERYLQAMAMVRGFESVVLRPGNLYGDPLGPTKQQGVVEHWFQRIAQREPLEAWYGLDVVRDYVHVDDMVDAVLGAIDRPVAQRVFNVGTGVGTSLVELAAIMRTVAGAEVPVISVGDQRADLPWNVLDPSAMRASFGFAPSIALAEGLRRTWSAYRV